MDTDVIVIAQSNIVDYNSFNALNIDRLDIFKTLVYPRMVRHEGEFMSHLDYINRKEYGRTYAESDYPSKRNMLNIWNMPSMAGIHLQNYLTSNNLRPHIVNNLDSEFDLLESLLINYPNAPIVISTTFYLQWKEVARIVNLIRPLTSAKLILGGAFINSYAAEHGKGKVIEYLEKYQVDYAIYSFNSEKDLLTLLKHILNESNIIKTQLKNTIYKDNDKYSVAEEEWNMPLIKEIKPIWNKLDIPSLNSTIQIRTASGCPFACAFCSYPTTAKVWETADSDNVREHLDSIVKIPNLKNIIFIDDTFNVPMNRFIELLEIFKEYDFGWYSFLRVQFVDDDVVRAMKESGCRGVYLGIESSVDNILKNMNKKARRKDFYNGISLLNKYDIDYVAAFVLGFPGETRETIIENIKFIEELKIKYYALKEFYYMENTMIHSNRDKYGLKGMGSRWTHNTMSYSEATEYKLRMFLSINNSVHLDPDTSLWHLAHLHDLGFSREDILKYQKEINQLIKNDLLEFSSTRKLEYNLSAVC